jgi:sugar phosphate isomerase/epimerase
MLIGWCAPLTDAAHVAAAGLDFIEVPIASLGLEDAASFAAAKSAITACPLPVRAFNTFMPKDMRVVGESIDAPRVRGYLARVAELCALAEARIIVFGSGWARNVPDGFERARAEAQFTEALAWSATALEGTGTTLVIEPLNRKESNIVNSVADGVRFAKLVARPQVRVLADFYHMDEEGEPLTELFECRDWLAHVHVADTGRRNPGTGSYPYAAFARELERAGYNGMISAECSITDPRADRMHSLAFLRKLWPA